MKVCIIILICIIFFLVGNVGVTFMNISQDYFIYFLWGYGLLILGIYKHCLTKIDWIAICIVASAFIWLCVRYFLGIRGEYLGTVCILALPAFLIAVFPHNLSIDSIKLKIILTRLLAYIYLTECTIAIAEYVLQSHIFGWIDTTYHRGLVHFGMASGFRAVALFGSPLNNALIVTIMMLFYLFNSGISFKRKIALWILGLTAVFCFNARGAIIVNLLSFAIFIVRYTTNRDKIAGKHYVLFTLITFATVWLMYHYGWGDRLWNLRDISSDSSINVRFRLFEYVSNIDWSNYLWGNSVESIRHEMSTLIGVRIIENFWILYIFHLGIVATLFFVCCYYVLCRFLLKPYQLFDKVVLAGAFLLLASSNNSLYSGFIPLFTFLFCCYVYQPTVLK